MKFTLLFYTDDWELGPTIELDHIPQPGSVVWTKGERRSDEDGLMYYVDNIMFPEKGLDRHDSIYIFARPYTGYTDYAPKTELDRVAEKIGKISDELAALRHEVSELNLRISFLGEKVSLFSDSVESKQQEMSDQLSDAVFALEDIKNSSL